MIHLSGAHRVARRATPLAIVVSMAAAMVAFSVPAAGAVPVTSSAPTASAATLLSVAATAGGNTVKSYSMKDAATGRLGSIKVVSSDPTASFALDTSVSGRVGYRLSADPMDKSKVRPVSDATAAESYSMVSGVSQAQALAKVASTLAVPNLGGGSHGTVIHPIIGSYCAQWSLGYASGYTCYKAQLAAQNGANWWVDLDMWTGNEANGTSIYGSRKLSRMELYTIHTAGHVIQDWTPQHSLTDTNAGTSCVNYTIGLDVSPFTGSRSSTKTMNVCEGYITPYVSQYNSSSQPWSGVYWVGNTSQVYSSKVYEIDAAQGIFSPASVHFTPSTVGNAYWTN